MITAQTHTVNRYILFGKTVQTMRILFAFFILQAQIIIVIVAPDQNLFELIPTRQKYY